MTTAKGKRTEGGLTPNAQLPGREGFTSAECAWLDEARRRWTPITSTQAAVIRRHFADADDRAEGGAA